MKTLILNWKDITNPDVGGAEIILYEFAKRLVSEGHDVTWFCRGYEGCAETEVIDGITIIRRGNKFTVYWKAYQYYRSLTKKPDRVVDCINTICWQTSLYVPKQSRLMYVNQLAREVFFYELPPVVSHIAYVLEFLQFQTYKDTRVVCYAPSVKKDLIAFGLPASSIDIFPLGLDHARYIPGKKSTTPLFVFVARLAAMKRPDLVVEAMQGIVARYPKARLAVVGYGPMQPAVERRINELGLGKNVQVVNKDALFFSASTKDQKVKLMQQAWALVLPSVKEGWGMVVTEAGACGTPTIATRVSGLIDSVHHKKTGLLVSPNPTPMVLSRAMIVLIEDKALRLRLARQARTFAMGYTWEKSYGVFRRILLKTS